MLKKHIHKILFCLTTLSITSLQAAHLLQQEEGKNNEQETAIIPQTVIGYYNYTLKYSKKPIDNGVYPNDLAKEQQDLTENRIAEKLKNRQDTIFFMVILYNKQTETRSKFFFFNSDPNTAQDVVWKVQRSHTCHVISHTKPMLSPHILFQLLGWLEQEKSKCIPIFIYASSAICGTCHAIIESFFNLHILSNAKGCNGCNSIDLENACPLAQQYLNRGLTVPLAKKLLSPTLCSTYKHRLKLLENKNNQLKQDFLSANQEIGKILLDWQNKYKRLLQSHHHLTVKKNKQIKSLKRLLKDRIELPHSPIKDHTRFICSMAVTKQYIVSGSFDYTIRIWELKTGKQLPYSPLKGHTGTVYSVAVTKDNLFIVSSSEDNTIRIWDLQTGKQLPYSPLNGHKNSVFSMVLTNNNKYIVSGSADNTIRIWDFKTGKELSYSPLKGHTNDVNSVALTNDNKYIVSGSDDHTIRIWHFKTGKELPYSPLNAHTGLVYSVAVTTDNKYTISASKDNTIRIWNLKTGKELPYSPLNCDTSWVNSFAITANNKFIVSGSNETVCIWDFKTGKQLPYSPLKGHTYSVRSVAISCDNRYIVSSSKDNTIRIWDFKTGKQLPYSPLKGHTKWVWIVAVTKDNKYIVSGSNDNTIRIWDLQLLAYLAQAEDEHKPDNDVDDNQVFDID